MHAARRCIMRASGAKRAVEAQRAMRAAVQLRKTLALRPCVAPACLPIGARTRQTRDIYPRGLLCFLMHRS